MRPWFCQMFHCVCSVDGRASPRGSSKRRPCSCSPKRVAEHCVVRGGGSQGVRPSCAYLAGVCKSVPVQYKFILSASIHVHAKNRFSSA